MEISGVCEWGHVENPHETAHGKAGRMRAVPEKILQKIRTEAAPSEAQRRVDGQRTHLGANVVFAGERPFLCTDCGKSFAQKSHLTCHLTMHSEERPYPCNLCDKSFKKKELLKHHMNLHGGKTKKTPGSPSGPILMILNHE